MRLLQLNLNHCEAAQDLLNQSVRNLDVDLCIISEQYRNVDLPCWTSDATSSSAIWAVNRRALGHINNTECGFVRATVSGICIYSCYIPPRYDIEDYKKIIYSLTNDATGRTSVVIAGDFNAWATQWGCPRTNERGKILLESFAQLDVVLMNTGNEHTYRRNGGGSTIDIAFVSENIRNRISWGISDLYTHSDHSAIIMDIHERSLARTIGNGGNLPGWKANTFDRRLFSVFMEDLELNGTPENMAEQFIMHLTRTCNASMRKRKSGTNKAPVYWWTEEIAELRKDCIRARRLYVRTRGRVGNELHRQSLNAKRKILKLAIRRSKRLCFLEICDDIEKNPFGLAYKLVRKKLKCLSTPSPMEATALSKIVTHLFPEQRAPTWNNQRLEETFNFPEVTLPEIQEAVSRFEDKKAPGPDGIPNLVLKEAVKCSPYQILRLVNSCLKYGSFPPIWKRQKLVLLPKDKKPLEDPSSYRPLCMIDTSGKLLERIICNRLEEFIVASDGLSKTQYGFRKQMSTIDAIQMVVKIARNAIEGSSWRKGSKEYCVLVTLDVKNAFNTANWENIVNALVRLNTPAYLVEIIKDYFRKRVLLYQTDEGMKDYTVTGGVPQGSVLGPLLWNLMYDGVLRVNLPKRATIIGFADDIALVMVAKSLDEARTISESGIQIVKAWLNSMGLTLADHKTEAVLISSRKKVEYLTIDIGGCKIKTKDCLKYLGVMIDNRLSFKQHFDYVRDKALNICSALCRIMPNTRGPRYMKRRVLAGVVRSVILYAAPIWAESTRFKTYSGKISTVYRLAALRVCSAYRTVSDEAVLVIAGLMPIDILARNAKWEFLARRTSGNGPDVNGLTTMAEWQRRWETSTKGRWTYALIPDLEVWISRRHGYLNFYLTQFLSGHGCFRSYLYRFGHDSSPFCPCCPEDMEDPEHVFFVCPRFDLQRANLRQQVGENVSSGNIIQIMLVSLENWEIVTEYVKAVLLELRRQEDVRRRSFAG